MAVPSSLTPAVDTELVATRLLYEMLGKRWTPKMLATDAYPLDREIILTGRPVSAVISVTGPSGDAVPAGDGVTTGYQLYSGFRLRLPRQTARYSQYGMHCGSQSEVTVEYIYGGDPPEQVRYAIWALAHELDLAIAGSDECKLPRRTVSVSRQGISVSLLEPGDLFEKGQTGISEVDFAISVFNPRKAKARSRVFGKSHPPARRLSVEMLTDTLLFILQGSDWSASWPIVDDAGDPQDLTGWSAVMQARAYEDNALLYTWSTVNGRLSFSGSNVVAVVPASVSSAWTWERAKFQLELTSPALAVSRVDEGRIKVDPEVTVT